MDLGAGGVEGFFFPGLAVSLMKLIFLLKWFRSKVLAYLGSVCCSWNAFIQGNFEEGANHNPTSPGSFLALCFLCAVRGENCMHTDTHIFASFKWGQRVKESPRIHTIALVHFFFFSFF